MQFRPMNTLFIRFSPFFLLFFFTLTFPPIPKAKACGDLRVDPLSQLCSEHFPVPRAALRPLMASITNTCLLSPVNHFPLTAQTLPSALIRFGPDSTFKILLERHTQTQTHTARSVQNFVTGNLLFSERGATAARVMFRLSPQIHLMKGIMVE